MNIYLCQFDIEWENKQKNKEKISRLLKDVSVAGLIILPEMCLTGFSFNSHLTEFTKNDLDFFRSIAKEKQSFLCFGAVLEEKNSCIIMSPDGEIISRVAKIHLFSPSGEIKHHKPGSSIKSVEIYGTRITPFICYDLRFAPLFWLSAEQTDIFVVIANWPSSRRNHWKNLLIARAIENQAFVIGANRTGNSPEEEYSGDSCVVDPSGNVILDAFDKEAVFSCGIDNSTVEQVRKKFPVLKDRKTFLQYLSLKEND